MYKKVTSILLIITTSASLIGCVIPAYAWYLTNYDYIVTYMCINRDKPQMHCNGSCQLRKMINREQHNTHKQTPLAQSIQKHKIDLFVTKHYNPLPAPVKILISSVRFNNQMETLCFFKPATPPPRLS